MSHMIPAIVNSGTPVSEKKIFERLQKDPATIEWVVLHSLGLPRTRIGPYGEVDFVILVPGSGVLCLEVKGGKISCNRGKWTQANSRTGEVVTLKKSPYLQSRENMFALRDKVIGHFGKEHDLAHTIFSCAVAFPGSIALPDNPESDAWETFDLESMKSPISNFVLTNLLEHKKKVGLGLKQKSVTKELMNTLRNYLRPDFERLMVRAATILESEEQLIALTEDQYDYIDSIDINKRAIVRGAAGTGKTVLAVEYAKRELLSGRRVLFVCYNKLLAQWIVGSFKNECDDLITVRTIHKFMRDCIRTSEYFGEFEEESKKYKNNKPRFFNEIMPLYAEFALQEIADDYDTVIVDEAQDLMSKPVFSVLNAALKGGLAGGRWALFCDDTRQAIYNATKSTGKNSIDIIVGDFSADYSQILLKRNCRNTRQIGEETALLSGFDSLPYRLGNIDGLSVDYRYWDKEGEQQLQLEKVLNQLNEDGVSPSDIIILGIKRFENTALDFDPYKIPFEVADVDQKNEASQKTVFYSTIYSFKGMESPIVILTGITGINEQDDSSLLYVGMSRARSHLVLLLHSSIRNEIPRLTKKKLTEGWGQ
jgi:hypothetical protein